MPYTEESTSGCIWSSKEVDTAVCCKSSPTNSVHRKPVKAEASSRKTAIWSWEQTREVASGQVREAVGRQKNRMCGMEREEKPVLERKRGRKMQARCLRAVSPGDGT